MRTKKTYIFIGILSALLSGCGTTAVENEVATESKSETKIETEMEAETIESSTTEPSENDTEGHKEGFFKDFKNLEFYFASGAGGWRTVMTIHEDGSFAGEYSDSDMGTGRYYLSNFSGQFNKPVKVNEYTYSMSISELHYEKEVGEKELKDGIEYVYTDAFGLVNAEAILVYLPGAPLSELPEGYLSWANDAIRMYDENLTELPFYGLYNETEESGFYSYDVVEYLYDYIESTKSYAESVEESLQKGDLSQSEMNEISYELYQIWDGALNYEWQVLKKVLDADTMSELLLKQREWITYKEAEVLAVYKEYEPGTIAPLIANDKAAELTKTRVYELLEYFENL